MQYYEQFTVQLHLHIRQNATEYETDSLWFRRQLIALILDMFCLFRTKPGSSVHTQNVADAYQVTDEFEQFSIIGMA